MLVAVWTVISYLMGCFNGAYYLVRWRGGGDIRKEGTGNPGARNAGRLMGRGAFLIVFLIDAGKGMLAVWVALATGLGNRAAILAAVAAVAGHILPVQLGFRGGKGIATAFGVILVIDPILAGIALAIAAACLVLLRRPAFSGTFAVVTAPLLGVIMQRGSDLIIGLAAIAVLGIIAHRADFPGLWNDRLRSATPG